MKIYTHTIGRFSLPQFQMFGFILFILGIYLLIISNWFGVVALLVGYTLYFTVQGIQIDFDRNFYREFIGLLNFKYGKWIKLPHVDYVTVYIENYSQRGSVASIDNANKFSKVKINLIVKKDQKLDAGFFNDKEEALKAALVLAKGLKTKLLDYTEKEPRWVVLES